jgi:hypothetical protein
VVEFLEGLSALLVFYSIAVLASLVLLIQIGLALLGFDEVDVDAGDGLSFLSLRSLIGFLGGFGWTGVILLENGVSLPAATAVGIGVGFLFMLSIAYVMKALYSLGESGYIDLANAVGQVGTVYLTVPAGQAGSGPVRVLVQGRLMMASAQTRAGQSIPSERKIRVAGLIDSRTLLVEPLGGATREEE